MNLDESKNARQCADSSGRRDTSVGPGAAVVAVGGLSAVLPFLHGGVGLRSELATAVVIAMAVAASAAGGARVPRAVLVLAVVPFAMAVQLIPLPPGVIGFVSSSADALFRQHLVPAGLYPRARALSLDPAATARELSRASSVFGALLFACLVATSRTHRNRLLGMTAGAGSVLAAYTIVSAFFGWGPLLESRIAFVNPNHLAGFLNATCFVALGLALSGRGPRRMAWLAGFAVSACGVLFSLSRGGIAAFFVGLVLFAVLYLRRAAAANESNSASARGVMLGAVLLALASVIGIAAYLALGPILRELQTIRAVGEEAKVQMWERALVMIRDYPVLGIGRGAFAAVYPEYKADTYPLTFTHLENEWLQPLVELGIPVGGLLVAGLATLWCAGIRERSMSRSVIGAAAGVAALAAQNAFDFSLEIVGVAVPFALLLGSVAKDRKPVRVPRPVLWTVSVAVAATALAGLTVYRIHDCDTEPTASAQVANTAEAMALGRQALMWHPADFMPPLTIGIRLAAEHRCEEALEWLYRSMQRNPTAPGAHRVAARCYVESGKHSAAQREYRVAYLMGDIEALDEAVDTYKGTSAFATVIPDLPDALLQAGRRVLDDLPQAAASILSRAWVEYGSVPALESLATAKFATGDFVGALEASNELQRVAANKWAGYVGAAEALDRKGQPDAARDCLERGLSRMPGSREILSSLAIRALRQGHHAEALRLAREISATTPDENAARSRFLAQVLQANGRTAEALSAARAARDATPRDLRTQLFLADLCAATNRYDEGIDALRAAATIAPGRRLEFEARESELQAARSAFQERLHGRRILEGGGP